MICFRHKWIYSKNYKDIKNNLDSRICLKCGKVQRNTVKWDTISRTYFWFNEESLYLKYEKQKKIKEILK